MRKVFGFTAILMLMTGCAETRYVAVPSAPVVAASPALQACAQHASVAQKATFGDDFNGLQLTTRDLVVTSTNFPVGNQPVASVFDGEGQWFGRTEYRKVRFHCMISPAGEVVYSFVRGE